MSYYDFMLSAQHQNSIESSQEYCYISWCIRVFEFRTSFKEMCNKLVIILTAIAKANACRTLNQKRRDYGFPCPVMTRDDKHNSNNRLFFPCILSSLNSCSELSALVIAFSWPGHLHSNTCSISKCIQFYLVKWKATFVK